MKLPVLYWMEFQLELKASIDSIISSWKLKAEEHNPSFFSDRTYEENIKEKSLGQNTPPCFPEKSAEYFL